MNCRREGVIRRKESLVTPSLRKAEPLPPETMVIVFVFSEGYNGKRIYSCEGAYEIRGVFQRN